MVDIGAGFLKSELVSVHRSQRIGLNAGRAKMEGGGLKIDMAGKMNQ